METFINDRLAMFGFYLIVAGMALIGTASCGKLIVSAGVTWPWLVVAVSFLIIHVCTAFLFVPKTIQAAKDYIDG